MAVGPKHLPRYPEPAMGQDRSQPDRGVTYWDFIRVEELLGLQRGVAAEGEEISNDEVMFITVHQIYELWFQLILRELRAARDLFTKDPVQEQELSGAVRSLKRIVTILRRCVDHFEVMETLTTREYLTFRDKLMPASGFQSAQLRQIEILFGLSESDRISLGVGGDYLNALKDPAGGDSPALRRVQSALADTPNLKDAIDSWLERTPIDGFQPGSPGEPAALDDFVERFLEAHGKTIDAAMDRALALAGDSADRDKLRARYDVERRSVHEFMNPTQGENPARLRRIRCAMIYIETYRELPLLAWPREVLDGLVEAEQLFVIFRQRHARMVERVIGRRTGTGGSAGVDYLDKTALEYRIFRDLWAVRTLQIPISAAPRPKNEGAYEFVRNTQEPTAPGANS